MALMPPRSGDQTSHADLFTAVRQRPANPVVGQAFFDSFGECQYFTNQSDFGGNGSISSPLVWEIPGLPHAASADCEASHTIRERLVCEADCAQSPGG